MDNTRWSALSLYIGLVTRTLAFDPNHHITLNYVKKYPRYTNKDIMKNRKNFQKLYQQRQTQMEIKRASDPAKQQLIAGSEIFRRLGGNSDRDSKHNDTTA